MKGLFSPFVHLSALNGIIFRLAYGESKSSADMVLAECIEKIIWKIAFPTQNQLNQLRLEMKWSSSSFILNPHHHHIHNSLTLVLAAFSSLLLKNLLNKGKIKFNGWSLVYKAFYGWYFGCIIFHYSIVLVEICPFLLLFRISWWCRARYRDGRKNKARIVFHWIPA